METYSDKNEAHIQKAHEETRKIAIIAYLTIIGLVIAFIMNNDKKAPFASYHIRQSFGLAICGLTFGMIGIIPILGWILSFVGIFLLCFMWIKGLLNAIKEKEKPVPFLGKKFEEWFKGV